MELSEEQLLAALKEKAELDRRYAAERPPLTQEQRQQLMQALRSAVEAEAEPAKSTESLADRFTKWVLELFPRPLAWAPVAALIIAALIALPLLMPGGEQWRLSPSPNYRGGTHPLKALGEANWTMRLVFAKNRITLGAPDGGKFSGSLVPAPDLNTAGEKTCRFYRVAVEGKTGTGLAAQGNGKLELKGAALASADPASRPKLADIESAELSLSLLASNYPPLEIIQDLQKSPDR